MAAEAVAVQSLTWTSGLPQRPDNCTGHNPGSSRKAHRRFHMNSCANKQLCFPTQPRRCRYVQSAQRQTLHLSSRQQAGAQKARVLSAHTDLAALLTPAARWGSPVKYPCYREYRAQRWATVATQVQHKDSDCLTQGMLLRKV